MITEPVHDLTVRIPGGEPVSLVRPEPGREFQFETESEGASFGFGAPVVATVESDLIDGTRGQIIRHENREAVFRVAVVAETATGLAEGEALLRSLTGGPAEVAWTPPDGWGATTVFEVLWSQMPWNFDDMDELRLRRTWTVTFTAKPFGRSVEKTITPALGSGEEVDSVTIDDASSTTDWSGAVGGTAEAVQDAGDSVLVVAPVTRRNLALNPSFEVNLGNWHTVGGPTALTRVTNSVFGTYAARAITPFGTTGRMSTTTMPVDPSTAYTLSAYIEAWGRPSLVTLKLTWYTASFVLISESSSSAALAPVFYARRTLTATAPPTAARVVARLIFADGGASGATSHGALVDGVQVEKASSASAYFDGSRPVAGTLAYRWTGTPHASASIEVPVGPTELTRSGLTEDFTDTPYLVVDFATSAGDHGSVAAEVVSTASGTVPLARDSLTLRAGGHRGVFECSLDDVEQVRVLVGGASAAAPLSLEIDNLDRSSSNAPFVSTARQLFRTIEVGGSADTQGSLSLSHETDALGDVLAYTSRDDGAGQPPLRQWRVDGGSITTDSDRVSGATSPLNSGTPETYEVPVSVLSSGTYALMARLTAASGGAKTINWTATTRYGTTDLGTVSGSALVDLTTGYANRPIANLALPPVDTPDSSEAVVRITLSSPDAVTIDEGWIFNLDTGALTAVSCGTGTPEAGGASNYLWIDTETLEAPAKVERGTLADRSDAHNAGADVSSMGAHEFTPGTVNAFTVTSNALNAAVALEHHERWGDNAVR